MSSRRVPILVAAAFASASAVLCATLWSAPARADDSRVRQVAQKSGAKKKTRSKKGAAKPADETPAPAAPTTPPGADDVKFSRDVAPILVANCMNCHNPERKRGRFDLTTFDALMKGADKEKVIAPGKPDESHIVLRLKQEETPKMPPGQNDLAAPAIALIEKWIKEGARLDAGIDPKAKMETYAASPEQRRRLELAKLTPAARDELVEKAGRARYAKGDPKVKPELAVTKNFVVFASLPKDRATALTKLIDAQFTTLKTLLSRPGAPVDISEKISVYVFNDRKAFVEFVRGVQNREVDETDEGVTKFDEPQPYIAVHDPLNGRPETNAGKKPAPRGRARKNKDDGELDAARSLGGVVVEQLAVGMSDLAGKGKTPRWLALGLGVFYSKLADPRGIYVRNVQRDAHVICTQGWASLAQDALGGQTKPEDVRAVGYAILDWVAAEARPSFPGFVRGMLDGQEKLDDTIQKSLYGTREAFLAGSSTWVMSRYGSRR